MILQPRGQQKRFSFVHLIIGASLVGALLSTIVLVARPSLARDNAATIEEVAKPLLEAANTWRASNPEGCPTIGGLVHEGTLSETAARHDPWGGAFRLICMDDGGFSLLSPGRDGLLGNEDDLEFPRR
jgi:hypothetical protein